MASGTAKVKIEVEGLRLLKARVKALEEFDLPNTRAAMTRGMDLYMSRAKRRAPRGTAITGAVLGATTSMRMEVKARGPLLKSWEFGRTHYYRLYRGRRLRAGARFRVPLGHGLRRTRERKVLGIINYGGGAWGETRDTMKRLLSEGIRADTYRDIPGAD